jgi:hypothetical protein
MMEKRTYGNAGERTQLSGIPDRNSIHAGRFRGGDFIGASIEYE